MFDAGQLAGVLVWLGVGLNTAAWALFLARRRRPAIGMLTAGWAIGLTLFVMNWVLAGEPPFGNMYHVHVFLALCFPALYVWLGWRRAMGWAGAYFAFTAALALIGAGCMDRELHWRRMPALQSPWFVPHVFAYMLSYALATLACVMTVVRRVRRRAAGAGSHAEAAHELIRIGFPFMTFGMLSGALWAEEAWGVYWSWDPKETWSLITWLGYLAFLHMMRDARTRRWADIAQAVAFAALLWTFFLVNLMPRLASVLHSYAS